MFRGRTKLSEYGNARLRHIFWMAARVTARPRDKKSFRGKLGGYTTGHADDADRHRKAMTTFTAKMVRVTHAAVKTGTEYRPFLRTAGCQVRGPLSARVMRALVKQPYR